MAHVSGEDEAWKKERCYFAFMDFVCKLPFAVVRFILCYPLENRTIPVHETLSTVLGNIGPIRACSFFPQRGTRAAPPAAAPCPSPSPPPPPPLRGRIEPSPPGRPGSLFSASPGSPPRRTPLLKCPTPPPPPRLTLILRREKQGGRRGRRRESGSWRGL